MGGKVALSCAAADLPGLEGLVVVAPSPPSPEPMDENERNRLLATHSDLASAERTLRTITRRLIPAEDVEVCIADNLRLCCINLERVQQTLSNRSLRREDRRAGSQDGFRLSRQARQHARATTDHAHDLKAPDRCRGCPHPLEAAGWAAEPLERAVISLDKVVEVL